jgi:hypothetical protein
MKIEVSNGEIIDKLTILSIKMDNIKDASKLKNINQEYKLLKEAATELGITEDHELYKKLMDINKRLWIIEDKIRECERNKDFGERFIELARSVYITNDERSIIKKEINSVTGSELSEEKSYKRY